MPRPSVCDINPTGDNPSVAQRLNIFRIDRTGDLVLKGEAETLDIAKMRVRFLINSKPAQYVILNRETGYKMFVRVEQSCTGHSQVI
jgi:hypothetical protein